MDRPLLATADALNDFADDLRTNFSIRIPAQPEDQLKGPIDRLVKEVARAFDLEIESRMEPHVAGLGARPDIVSLCEA